MAALAAARSPSRMRFHPRSHHERQIEKASRQGQAVSRQGLVEVFRQRIAARTFRGDSTGRGLTTNQGTPVADIQNSLKAGLRGPTLMEDFILREKAPIRITTGAIYGNRCLRERFHERMPHPRAGALRKHIERPRIARPQQNHPIFFASRPSAPCKSGCSVSTGASGSVPSFFIRATAVFSVNLRGSSFAFTSDQRNGIDTVAPATGRAL